jgi:hypothetical protein
MHVKKTDALGLFANGVGVGATPVWGDLGNDVLAQGGFSSRQPWKNPPYLPFDKGGEPRFSVTTAHP